MRGTRAEEGGASLTEQIAVMQLVDCVLEVETAQERVRRQLSCTQNVTAAVGLDLAEGEQLAHAAIEVAPHPPVNRAQDPIQRCDSRDWRHIDFPEEEEEDEISISV